VVRFKYDYNGRRIMKVVENGQYDEITLYCYDDQQVIAEYQWDWDTSAYVLARKFIYGPGIDEPLVMSDVDGQSETWYYYHFDALGSVVALSNVNGAIVEGYTYSVFGETTINTSAGTDGRWVTPDGSTAQASPYDNPYMYTARRYDPQIDSYHYRARMYNPFLGRGLGFFDKASCVNMR